MAMDSDKIRSAKDEAAWSGVGAGFAVHAGPMYCGTCGAWPALQCEQGPRCYLCELRDFAAANPVSLPNGRDALHDLASIGAPGAQEKLSRMANAELSGVAEKEKL